MSAPSVPLPPELLARPDSAAPVGEPRTVRRRMIALAKLIVVGGLAFVAGFLGVVAIRSLSLAASATTIAGVV